MTSKLAWDRVAELVAERIEACRLDLSGWTVITEAATNAYAATAGSALAAGAEVWALAKDSRFGSVEDCIGDVSNLVASLGCRPTDIRFEVDRNDLPWDAASLITNSGFLRPLVAGDIVKMRPKARIALMYEAWEARFGDIDYRAAHERGIEVIGVNEHHPMCDAFKFVGDIAVNAADKRGWLTGTPSVGVVSDNAFGEEIVGSLSRREIDTELIESPHEPSRHDLVIVAATPSGVVGSSDPEWAMRAVLSSGARKCVHMWGDLDHAALADAGIHVEPRVAPSPGHQAIGMDAVGPEPVIRLLVAGLAAVAHDNAEVGSPEHGLAQRRVELGFVER